MELIKFSGIFRFLIKRQEYPSSLRGISELIYDEP